MPSIGRLAKLFEAIASNNLDQAQYLAGLIAKDEERRGHHTAAQGLRGALRPNGRSNHSNLESSSDTLLPATTITSALTPSKSDWFLKDVVLGPASRKELLAVIAEWRIRSRLTKLRINRRSKLLFHGPPGCGKSICARAIGNELSLPTYVVRFDAVVGAFLGQTALNLRHIFRFAETLPCVVLLDELDALGSARGNLMDVGELNRIVIALMQELEHSVPRGLIIAATNLPQSLDKALWRRFDLVMHFPTPSARERIRFARRSAALRKIALSRSDRSHIHRSKSFDEIDRHIEAIARHNALKSR